MKRLSLVLISFSLISVSLGVVLLAAAQESNTPPISAAVLHPTFPLLDHEGVNVLESGGPVSTMQTCGACHDTAFIAEHSVHTDAGLSLIGATDDDPRAWVNGLGWYGGWNPITYPDSDLSVAEWVQQFGWRHVGGGPAAEVGVEMNCFLCHMPDADNTARIAALESGQFEWASTATLSFAQPTGTGWALDPAAFDTNGHLLRPYITLGAPRDTNCGFCHGQVDTNAQIPLTLDPLDARQWTTQTTGQIFSPQRISSSGMNIEGKAQLNRSWDVHAERVVGCTDCHYALNNPIFYVEPAAGRPEHLAFDPRRMDYDDFLLRQLHQFANGGQKYQDAFPVFERGARDCATCHDAAAAHTWLEYADRHLSALACETCHIPTIYGPALASVDWTVLDSNGEPLRQYRGVDFSGGAPFITGYQPVLLPDSSSRLAPHNIVSAWYWVAGDPAQPVTPADLTAVYLDGSNYAPEILNAFDANTDGQLTDNELVLDSDAKIALIAERLRARGLDNPRIAAESQAYPLHHAVTHDQWATRDCATCHTEQTRLSQSFLLTSYTPGAVQPLLLGDNLTGSLETDSSGGLRFTPSLAVGENGLYILGHHSVALVDALGALIFVGSMLAVVAHAGLRFVAARRLPKPHDPALREVYMYTIYERQWHWLQTAVIFGLIFTGMVIHKPDIFGMFSFQGVVLVHNALALLLVINAALAAFYHLASGEIKQFIPEPRGFFGQMFAQARYYAYGIFRGEPHPFEKTRNRKMNPIQQITYFGLLNVLLPLQVITGVLMWGAQQFPALTNLVGGLPVLGPVHTLVSWLLATFIVVHVYMTTTGHTPLANIRAMIFGWDEVETHQPSVGQESGS
jgi:thiosulfate reductase cytochrome b subunit